MKPLKSPFGNVTSCCKNNPEEDSGKYKQDFIAQRALRYYKKYRIISHRGNVNFEVRYNVTF